MTYYRYIGYYLIDYYGSETAGENAMKRKLILSIMITIIMCLLVTGCVTPPEDGDAELVKALRIIETSPKSFAIGEDLNLSDIKIEVEYKSGKKEIIALSETMISDEDRPKFTTVGAGKTVLITYGGRTIPFSFEVTESKQTKYYYVHFESNGGSVVESQFVSVIETFTIPTKTGYTFLGWHDNVGLTGNKAMAPLPVTKETTFYANWEDNRRWKVEFFDINGDAIPAYEASVVHGENVTYRPNGLTVEGYTFDRWDGQFDNITENTQIKSIYNRIYCTINYYFNYLEEGQSIQKKTIAYGEPFPVEERLNFQDKVGFTGRWMIRDLNNQNREITNQFDRVTSTIEVIPVYEIIKYTLTFQDDSAFLGSGTSWSNIIKTVNYGSDLSLTTGENVSSPQPRIGHTQEWAVRINDQWTCIKNGAIWNDDNSEWMPLPIPVTSIDLKNSTGDTITTITNGTMFSAIKGNIQIQAKYVKNKHNLVFRRGQKILDTVLSVPYDTKFKLYNIPLGEQDPSYTYGSKDKTYFVNHNAPQDWNIEWYPNNQWVEDQKLDFDNSYVTIKGDMTYYCKDIDLRIYEVMFYDWDFENSLPVLQSISQVVDGQIINTETQIIPHGGDAVAPTLNNQPEYGYELVDNSNYWFDAPQNAGYARQIYINGITADTQFYARYRISTYSITFRDYFFPYDDNENADALSVIKPLPEVTYDKDEAGNTLNTGYLRMDAVYFRNFGHNFNLSEIYYGGDSIYENKLFIEQYGDDEELYEIYNAQLSSIKADIDRYEGYLKEISDYEISKLAYTSTPEAYERYLILKPNHDTFRSRLYEASTKLDFINAYKIQYYAEGDSMPSGANVDDENLSTGARERAYLRLKYGAKDTNGNYIVFQDGAEGKYVIINNIKYLLHTDINGKYVDNGDYERYVDLFYRNEGRVGFEFDGWYTSPNFNVTTRVNSLDEIQSFRVINNIVLYAKWVDLEKGSDGLVFEKLREPNPEYTPENGEDEYIYYFKVIDYLSADQWNDKYKIVHEGEETYYEFSDATLPGEDPKRRVLVENISRNPMPATASNLDASVKIPSTHQSQYLFVKALSSAVFLDNADKIAAVDITANIKTIEEGAFATCYMLEIITLSNENISFMLEKGVLYTADGKTLMCYPARMQIAEYTYLDKIVPSTTFIVEGDVERIAKGAFGGCTHLKYIALADSEFDLTIGEGAFAGLGSLQKVGNLLSSSRLNEETSLEENIYISNHILPDRLVRIEAKAFQGCSALSEITTSNTSRLIFVGADAFFMTTWYHTRENSNAIYLDGTQTGGIIMLGYVALGLTNDFTGSILEFNETEVKAIADFAFSTRIDLKEVRLLNANFRYIGASSFQGCNQLKVFEMHNMDPAVCILGDAAFMSAGSTEAFRIYVPPATNVAQAYRDAPGWSQHADKIVAGSY